MKLRNCIAFALSEIYVRRNKIILILIMLTVSLVMILNQLILAASQYSKVIETKSILAEDEEDIYIIDFSAYAMLLQSEETANNIIDMLEEISELPNVKGCGTFMYGDSEEYEEVLYISEDIISLCELRYRDGGSFDWEDKPLAEKSKWISDAFDDAPTDISMYHIRPMSELVEQAPLLIGLSLNNVYIIAEDGFSVLEVEQCAKKYHLNIGAVSSMDQIMETEIGNIYEEGIVDEILIPLLIALISVFGYMGTMFTYLYTERRKIGILYSIGYSRKDYLKIISTMNGIIFFLSYILAFLYEYKFGIAKTFSVGNTILIYILPGYTMFVLLLTIIGTIVPLLTMWKRQPIELIGGYK